MDLARGTAANYFFTVRPRCAREVHPLEFLPSDIRQSAAQAQLTTTAVTPHDLRSFEPPNECNMHRVRQKEPVLDPERTAKEDPTNLCGDGIHDGHEVVDAAQVLVRQRVHLKTAQQVAPDFSVQDKSD